MITFDIVIWWVWGSTAIEWAGKEIVEIDVPNKESKALLEANFKGKIE